MKADIEKYNKLRSKLNILTLDRAEKYYEILYVVDRVMTKFKIDYSIACGTLLGALRHGGLIPWDDDLDVMVFDPDQEKMFDPMVIREFNKYGLNGFRYTHTKKRGINYVNHVYKETRWGSESLLTDKYLKLSYREIPNGVDEKLYEQHECPLDLKTSKYNGGRQLRDVEICDFFPHRNVKGLGWIPDCLMKTREKREKYILTDDDIWPLKRIKFGNFEVSVINNSIESVKKWAGEDFMNKPYWSHGHGRSPYIDDKLYIKNNAEIFKDLVTPCTLDLSKYKNKES